MTTTHDCHHTNDVATLTSLPPPQNRSMTTTTRRRRRQVLYGRQHEIATLREWYWTQQINGGGGETNHATKPTTTTTHKCILVVTGPARVGKRSLIEEIVFQPEAAGDVLLVTATCCGCYRHKACHNPTNKDHDALQQQQQQHNYHHNNNNNKGSSPSQLLTALNDAFEFTIDNNDHKTLESWRKDILPNFFNDDCGNEWEMILKELLTPFPYLKWLTTTTGTSTTTTKKKESRNCATTGTTRYQEPPTKVPSLHHHTHATTTKQLAAAEESSMVLARFLLALSTFQPLTIVLDQAECVDAITMAILQRVVMEDQDSTCCKEFVTKGISIIVCYRNDTKISNALAAFLERWDIVDSSILRMEPPPPSRNNGWLCIPTTIHVNNLSRDEVYKWIVDELSFGSCCNDDDVAVVLVNNKNAMEMTTDYFMEITNGNPRFVRYLLSYMKWNGYHDRRHDDNDSVVVQCNPPIGTRVEDLYQQMVIDYCELAKAIVDTVAALSVGGGCFVVSTRVIEMVVQQPCTNVICMLVEADLLEISHHNDRICFPNHDLLIAAYNRIPEHDRALAHLRIGRTLWKYYSSSLTGTDNVDDSLLLDDDGSLLYTIAHQLFRGIEVVTDIAERSMIATLFIRLGKNAMQSSRFTCAVSYFEIATSILQGDNMWTQCCYDISLELHNCLAEAYYCTGDFHNMDRVLDGALRHAVSLHDRLRAYTTMVHAHGARYRLQEAVDTALRVLVQLGEPIPAKPTKRLVLVEYLKTRWLLQGKRDRYFLNLPPAEKPDKIAAIALLNFTSMYAYLFNVEVAGMALFRMLRLTQAHGMSSAAIPMYGLYGVLLCSFGYIREAYRYGQLSLALLDRFDTPAWLPRIYVSVYGFIHPWVCPIRESLVPLRFAQGSALKTGDIEGSVMCSTIYLTLDFYNGATLPALEREARSFLSLTASMGQVSGLVFLFPLWNLFVDLSCRSTLDSDEACQVQKWEAAFNVEIAEKNNIFVAQEKIWRMVYHCFMAQYEQSIEMAKNARVNLVAIDYCLDFYEGLSAMALAHESRGRVRRQLIATGRRAIKNFRRWSRMCPANFRNKDALLRAESARLKGKVVLAQSLYNTSIEAAKAEGFVHEEGLAYERLAEHHSCLGHINTAIPCYTFALQAYTRWGATAAVNRMEKAIATKYSKGGLLPEVPIEHVDTSSSSMYLLCDT